MIFMRKIGYSVGLENTADRVDDLTSIYLQKGDVNLASWHKLVTDRKEQGGWGRNTTAEKHIADFFCSLRLIQRTPGDILILENLDAIAIVSKLLDSESQKRAARDFVLLWAILTNDGEVFVNLLLADFEEDLIQDTLRGMMLKKRAELANYLGAKASTKRIYRVITIERQDKNKGSAGTGQTITSLKRTQPLQPEIVVERPEEAGRIEFSTDYLDKVPKSRRNWAISLKLWDEEKGLTQRGRDFIDGLRKANFIDGENHFTFWPMDFELARAGFRPDLLCEANSRSLWKCLSEFAKAYTGLELISSDKPQKEDIDNVADLVEEMMKVYRSLHLRKALLRRELPMTVAFPAAVAIACAKGGPLTNFPRAIELEQSGERRRLAFRRSRNTGGALSTKK